MQEIQPNRVRYIKLGREGRWERECLETGVARFGYNSASDERYPICCSGRWADLNTSFQTMGKDKGTATRLTNETRLFFEDAGTTLWITFMKDRLHWGFFESGTPVRHASGDGVFRRVIHGWTSTDVNGDPLLTGSLSGAITKLAAYRGTSCDVDAADYVIRRINGHKIPQVEQANAAIEALVAAVVEMLKILQPKDFEILVDLVFSTSGWRRQGMVGGVQKTLDLDLVLPSTGERGFVQVKSRTDRANLEDYVDRLAQLDSYQRMFFVYHSGFVESDNDRVTIIGPSRLARMIVDAGLASWLIQKVA